MATCYMLIGVPGSGKSTYIKSLQEMNPSIISVSSDEYLEKIAKEQGKTYSDVHRDYIKEATKWMNDTIQSFVDSKKDFIWDQTNINQKARQHKLQILKKANYNVIGVTFEVDSSIIYERISIRHKTTGKHIPTHIIESMTQSYQRPDYSEGFSAIFINNGFGGNKQIPQSSHKNLKI